MDSETDRDWLDRVFSEDLAVEAPELCWEEFRTALEE